MIDQDTLDRLTALEKDSTTLKRAVAENTRITNEINNTTGELLELFKTAKGGFRAAYWIGNFLKWAFGLIAAGAAAYVAAREFMGK